MAKVKKEREEADAAEEEYAKARLQAHSAKRASVAQTQRATEVLLERMPPCTLHHIERQGGGECQREGAA